LADVAGAWTSPYNTYEYYYMPGPPPGSYLSGCDVQTSNGSYIGYPDSTMYDYANSYSSCNYGETAVVYDQNGSPVMATPYQGNGPNSASASLGPSGDGDIGGSFIACNTSYYCLQWSTSWI